MDIQPQSIRRSKVAILWRGDAASRREATPENSRFVRVFEALAASGIEANPVVYDETFADLVRDQLLTMDGVLVWVDPIHQGKTRAALDLLLREVAAIGYTGDAYHRLGVPNPHTKMVAALWRESPVPKLAAGQRLQSLTGLLHRDADGAAHLLDHQRSGHHHPHHADSEHHA